MPRKYVRKTDRPAMSWAFRQLPFWERVDAQTIVNENGCHIFTGSKDECGYGRIRGDDGKLVRVHRAEWERAHGKLGRGKGVYHTCDDPACRNIAHLFSGEQADNISDMDKKGRRVSLTGSKQPMAKLKEDQIPAIRSLLACGKTCAWIAQNYGVSEGLIRHIKKGRIWKHVDGA